MEEQIKEVVNKIADDIKGLAKQYGALIVVILSGIYIWKNIIYVSKRKKVYEDME